MGVLRHLNVGCADASIIETAGGTFLVDCHNIEDYKRYLPASKHLLGVFVTHQHKDHFSGLQYLRDYGYSIGCLIYSPYERRYGDHSVTLDEWNEFNSHRDYFKRKGTSLYTPYRPDDISKPLWETAGIKFRILGPAAIIAKSETRELHDACLVIHATLGTRRCLFTGDASDINLLYVADNTKNYCDDILHASHHGSINGAELSFIKKAKAKYTVVSTATGVHDNVPHPTAMQRYYDHTSQRVYRTDEDGSLDWTFSEVGVLTG